MLVLEQGNDPAMGDSPHIKGRAKTARLREVGHQALGHCKGTWEDHIYKARTLVRVVLYSRH